MKGVLFGKLKRNRVVYLGFILLSILCGLASRTEICPDFLYPYIGDYFYAIMVFFMVGFLFPKTESLKIMLISLSFCYLIELLQLYQADWINTIRISKLGGLILGFGFLWSDMICYTLGGVSLWLLEKKYLKRTKGI